MKAPIGGQSQRSCLAEFCGANMERGPDRRKQLKEPINIPLQLKLNQIIVKKKPLGYAQNHPPKAKT